VATLTKILLQATHTFTRNYVCGHIYQEFIITTHFYIYYLIIQTYDTNSVHSCTLQSWDQI